MKKNSLIHYFSLMGLTLAGTSCEKQESNSLEKNAEFPTPQRGISNQSIGYTPMVELNLPDSVNNYIIALATLAKDAFENSLDVQSFSENPKKYLISKGLDNCNIDLNSVEVKAILAFGDKEIQESLNSNDPKKFIQLLHDKNYISLNDSYLRGTMKNYLDYEMINNQDLINLLNDQAVISKSDIFLVLVIYQYASVIHTISAYTKYLAWTETKTDNRIYSDTPNYIFQNPVLKLWSLKTNSSDIPVVNEFIEKQINILVDIIESSDFYKEANSKFSREDLKTLIRKPVTQSYIDANLL